jgi:hypothetical protein
MVLLIRIARKDECQFVTAYPERAAKTISRICTCQFIRHFWNAR